MTPKSHPLPPGLVTLADHATHAKTLLPEATWAYFNGGAGDETTLRANLHAWQTLNLHPRVLRPLNELHTNTSLLGKTWPSPLLVAPMANQCLAHPDGESATALAASALGAGMVLSTQSNTPLESVARLHLADPGRGPLWFQLYALADRGWMLELTHRAKRAGFEALVLTVDAPIQGVRDAERRAGFALPPSLPQPHVPPSAPATLSQLLQQAPTWDDVQWLLDHAPLPVLLKGITHPADAQQACGMGVAGVIVSNHGGRVLDTMPATAHLLPSVASAVQGKCAVLADGGIRRGTDVLKALALGADAVLLGRPVLHGLANAGANGVAHVLRLLSDELMAAMALCGINNLKQANNSILGKTPSCL